VTAKVGLGIAQISAEPYEVEHNKARCRSAIVECFSAGAELVVLPELIVQGYVADRLKLLPIAETIPGPTVDEWTELAAAGHGYVVGGLVEREDDRLYNSAIAVGPEGPVAHYRKVHLFGGEKHTFAPGDLGFPTASTRFGTIGVCVCYDLRFVEVTRILSLRGADLICVPTAWVSGFDQALWDDTGMAPQARTAEVLANLSQVYIACASQAGRHGGQQFLGSSVVIDPYGRRSMGPLSGTSDQVETVFVDLGDSHRSQVRGDDISPRADRRRDVYGIKIGDEVL
jgi:N-carbamoylputrescine amidase